MCDQTAACLVPRQQSGARAAGSHRRLELHRVLLLKHLSPLLPQHRAAAERDRALSVHADRLGGHVRLCAGGHLGPDLLERLGRLAQCAVGHDLPMDA